MRRYEWRRTLDYESGARIVVQYAIERREVMDYAVVLVIEHDGQERTVRVYDGAHGINEMHRHTIHGGKSAGKVFHAGTLGEGMRRRSTPSSPATRR